MEYETKYRQAVELFEKEDYEEAVELLIHLFKDGYEQESILKSLYDSFVMPNEAEFRKNYNENGKSWCNKNYEDTLLDFIPVSDTKYYIFHKKYHKFLGNIDIAETEEVKQELEVHSVLIADVWDLRDMIPYIKMRNWNTCYILMDKNKEEFLSFLKLPDIEKKYLQNAVVFFDKKILEQFFLKYPEFYLPKEIVSGHQKQYREMFWRLHQRRIEDMETERKNILLSICIPSYGRGSTLLENVEHLLQVSYDTEIEIVVSNNGSTEDAGGYEKVKHLKDSRITYYEFKENQGYMGNICKTLELAKGQFVVFCSDEDFMKVENLHDYLNYLLNHMDMGVCYVSGIGPNFRPEKEEYYETGIDAYLAVIDFNYVTGVTLNRVWMEHNHVLEKIRVNKDNKFVALYTHIAMVLLTVEGTSARQIDIVLWETMVERKNVEEDGAVILSYMHYESRIEQQNSAMDFIEQAMNVNAVERIWLLMGRMDKTYFLCMLAYGTRTEAYRKIIEWRELCRLLHENNIRQLEHCKKYLQETELTNLQYYMEKLFLKYIQVDPTTSVLLEQKQTDDRTAEETVR